MAIEGPLRELGIHDVFQLLDLSRKTGTLAVRSDHRDNEGSVSFESGRVVAAAIRSNPHRLGDVLLRSGKVSEADIARARAAQQEPGDARRLGDILLGMGVITAKELERQVRLQIEEVVFELLSWGEGFFRFEEGTATHGADGLIQISIESLLMEGARRIDEWSHIADRVPNLDVVPHFASLQSEPDAWLDLLPGEWEVLTMIDGERDLREIAALLGRSEFDIAKVVYGLACTDVVTVHGPADTSRPPTPVRALPALEHDAGESTDDLEAGFRSLRRGDLDGAVQAWNEFLRARPHDEWTGTVRVGVEAVVRLRDMMERRYGE